MNDLEERGGDYNLCRVEIVTKFEIFRNKMSVKRSKKEAKMVTQMYY